MEQPWIRYFWGVNIQLSLESNNSSKSVFDEKLGLRPWRHVIAVGLCTEVPRTYSTPLTASRMTGRAVRVFLLLSSSASLDWQIGFPASFLKDITQDFADFLAQHWIESGRRLEERNWVSNLDSSGGSSYLRAKLAALWEHSEILNFGSLCLRTSTSNTQSCLWVYVYRLLKKALHFSSAKLLYQFRKCLLLKGPKN